LKALNLVGGATVSVISITRQQGTWSGDRLNHVMRRVRAIDALLTPIVTNGVAYSQVSRGTDLI